MNEINNQCSGIQANTCNIGKYIDGNAPDPHPPSIFPQGKEKGQCLVMTGNTSHYRKCRDVYAEERAHRALDEDNKYIKINYLCVSKHAFFIE